MSAGVAELWQYRETGDDGAALRTTAGAGVRGLVGEVLGRVLYEDLEPEFEPQPARHNTNGIKAVEMFRMGSLLTGEQLGSACDVLVTWPRQLGAAGDKNGPCRRGRAALKN